MSAIEGSEGEERACCDFSESTSSALFDRGLVFSHNNDYEAALAKFSESIRLYPTPEAYNMQGLMRSKLGRYTSAISDFSTACSRGFPKAEYYWNRGNAHVGLAETLYRDQSTDAARERRKASQDYSKAIALCPEARFYKSRADEHKELREYYEAIRDYTAALSFKGCDQAKCYFARAYCHWSISALVCIRKRSPIVPRQLLSSLIGKKHLK